MYKILLLFLLILCTNEDEINIRLDSEITPGTEFTFENDILTITNAGTYTISGSSISVKSLIISSTPVTINLKSVSLTSTGKKTPLIISRNCEVTLNIIEESSFKDTNENEKDGVIYMEKSSKLTIISEDISEDNEMTSIFLIPYKGMGIYGEESTNLNINGNIYIYNDDEGEYIGGIGIYIGNDIIINDGYIVIFLIILI